ncbi:hypothetical protein PILCRDRAFT_15280 [Piloderma croceum F 1598]|uniref:Uncharacterized protein n=1 Tax=Piloderma croceum (strain F 1598) TaxID=765440 RepID=A0A0C3B7U0_PILCF|nr:hypothetical protein PILCRDRAFT_16966 [Piloderma croceum F 1598]KIM73372.1 hypothetical protein PILCRDRAFT_15280 [Piloderma croceum F 1598]
MSVNAYVTASTKRPLRPFTNLMFSIHLPAVKLPEPLSSLTQCIFVNTNTSPNPKSITFITCPLRLLCIMPPSKTPMAAVKQSSPSKVPILMAGDISPAVMYDQVSLIIGDMHALTLGTKSDNNRPSDTSTSHRTSSILHDLDIDAFRCIADRHTHIIGGILDNRVSDWISTERDCLIALSFDTFMIDFHTNYLAEDWEDTTLHLPDDKLHHQINAGMEIRLSKKTSSKKVNKVADFRKWLNEVRSCDEGLHAEREEYERIARDNHESFHCTNYSNDPPSRHTPYTNLPATGPSAIVPAVSSEP